MAAPEEPPFIVRAWPVDASRDFDERREATLTAALNAAIAAGNDSQYRGIMVTDDFGVLYAQVNMLWQVPSDLR